MYQHAAPGFVDLRVLDARGRQVPWRLTQRAGRRAAAGGTGAERRRRRAARRSRSSISAPSASCATGFSSTCRSSRSSAARRCTAATTAGRFTRLSSTSIYDVRGATRAVSTAVVFPPSDFRYYRIRATGVNRRFEAQPRRRWCRREPVEREAEHHRASSSRGKRSSRPTSHYRGVTVHEVRFASSTPAFDRPVEITGSNDGQAFFPVGGGRLYRFGSAGETTVPLDSRYRYLRIRIANGDDPPLRRPPRHAARVSRLRPARAGLRAARIACSTAGRPCRRSTTSRSSRRCRGSRQYVVLGPERRNEAFEAPPDTRSFAERHPALITLALALAAATLVAGGLLALRRRT